MPINFENIFQEVKLAVTNLIRGSVKDYTTEAINDGKALLDKIKTELKEWTEQLATGKLSPKDFEFLVLGRKEEVEMAAITKCGMAEAKIDQLKSDILSKAISIITASIL